MTRSRKQPMHVGRAAGNGPVLIAGLVDDPYEQGKLREVIKNAATCPVQHLYARGRLGPETEGLPRVVAALRFQCTYERAEIGGSRAIDYGRQKVDTSFAYRGIGDRTVQALRELAAIREGLRRSYDVVEKVAGQGMSLRQYCSAQYGGQPAPGRARVLFTKMLIAGLDDLIEFYGVARGPVRGRMKVERAA